jgi:hypothetical protein
LIAVAAATAVAGLALAGWGLAPRTDTEGRTLGPRMAIDLVAPREPEIVDGGILEVGQINDGFDDAALERVAEVEDPTYGPEDAYAGPDHDFAYLPRMPLPRPVVMEDVLPVDKPPPPRRDALDDGSRWFGLDRLLNRGPTRRAEPAPMMSGPEPDRRDAERAEGSQPTGPRPYYGDRYDYSSE